MTTLTDRIPPGKPVQYALITQIVTCSCGRESRVSKLWKDMRTGRDGATRREQCSGDEPLYANIPWAVPGTTRSATARCDQCIAHRMTELTPMDLLPQGTQRLTPAWAAKERAAQEARDRVAKWGGIRPKVVKPAVPTAQPSDFA